MDIDAIINANGTLFRTWFPDLGISLSYRLLSLKEYKVFRSLRDGGIVTPYIVNEMVFKRCYLGEYSLLPKDQPAGIAVTLGGLILWLSGDSDNETLLEDIFVGRQLNPRDTVHEYMRSAIIAAFPTTTLETLESLNRIEFIKRFCIAENILSKHNPEYQELNLSEIETSRDQSKSKKPEHGINFERENAAIRKHMGATAINEQLVREREANKKPIMQKKKLSYAELRALQGKSNG